MSCCSEGAQLRVSDAAAADNINGIVLLTLIRRETTSCDRRIRTETTRNVLMPVHLFLSLPFLFFFFVSDPNGKVAFE